MKKIIKFFVILLLIILLVLGYSRYLGTSGLVTHEYKIETSSIDGSFDGLKVIHFTDLHYLRVVNKNILGKIVKEINLIKPDIVFFTGDLIDKDFDISDKEKEELINLLSNINTKYGKYAVIGNHDYIKGEEELIDIYSQSDFTLLQNSYDIIYRDNSDKLFIGGVDTYSYDKADIDKVMEYFADNEDISYKIMLVHEPDYADTILSKYDVNLILAGHSHNGQVNIPVIKKVFLPFGSKKYYENYYNLDGTPLYVSSGIGESRVDFRLFNTPSINFYRINKEDV